MTKDDPYSQVQWRFRDEYPSIYADDAALGLWVRLLVESDIKWPHAALLPYGVRRKTLDLLVDAGLVELLEGGMYHMRGQAKQRERRRDRGVKAARARWDGNADADARAPP